MQSILKSAICEATTRCSVKQFGSKLRAIILTGSLARGEASFQKTANIWHSEGDAEFFLVFQQGHALPADPITQRLAKEIETTLRVRKIDCHISLAACHEKFFRKLTPRIFAYELKVHGVTVWGDDSVLSRIPQFAISDIPLEDGWRLLCNRMIEFIEAAVDSPADSRAFAQRCNYKALKLYLDMATSYLLFAGAYEPTYRTRAERLKVLSAAAPENTPFALREFSNRVSECTGIKLGDIGGLDKTSPRVTGDSLWQSAVEYATRLWHWELALLIGPKAHDINERALINRWIASQPLSEKIRGWLYVLRKQGWHRSWPDWPRWGRYGLRASPRSLVYAAASELFFSLPLLVQANGHGQPALDWEGLGRLLPIMTDGHSENGKNNWRHLASEIAWNYHEFLEGTRA